MDGAAILVMIEKQLSTLQRKGLIDLRAMDTAEEVVTRSLTTTCTTQ